MAQARSSTREASFILILIHVGEDPNCSDSLEMWDPIDHLYYAGYFSHDPGAIAANCGPLMDVTDFNITFRV